MRSGDSTALMVFLLLTGGSMSGCIDTEVSEVDEPPTTEDVGFRLEWSVPDDKKETVFMVNVTTGVGTTCKVSQWSRYRFGSETGVASISFGRDSEGNSGFSTAIRGGETVHAGPVNTDTVGAESWGGLLFEGTGRTGSRPGNGTSYEGITGVFDLRRNDDDPTNLSVDCTSDDVLIRLYLADSYQPVIDKSARGGIGAHAGSIYGFTPSMTINHEDLFTIETDADEVRFFAKLLGRDGDTMDTSVDGELRLNPPGASETVPLEEFQDESVFYRSWTDSGEYVLELDQFSVETGYFVGLLAGFTLEEEWGSLHDAGS